jgi:hypothetical protein
MPLWTPGFVDKSKLLAWFKADAITGFADGIGITPWVDSSGNGKNAIQATGINRPLYRTNQINGLPSVQFVSSDSVAPPLSGSLITEKRLQAIWPRSTIFRPIFPVAIPTRRLLPL